MTLHDDTPAVRSEEWDAALRQAFGEVLGRPLAEYDAEDDGDARYGTFYSGNFLAESELERDPVWVGRAALAGEEPAVTGHLLLTPPCDLDEVELVFDASRSLFHVDPRGLPAGLAAFAADLAAAVAESEAGPWDGALLGADLGRAAERHGVDLTSPDLPAELWTLWRGRLASGGETLLDALLAATGLTAVTSPGELPTGVGDAGDDLDEDAHAQVAAVADPALRDYLVAFCDPVSHDLAFVLPTAADEDEEEGEEDDDEADGDEAGDESEDGWDESEGGWDESEGGSVVVFWEGAVDQYEITVRRL
ncbi:hypothetical protein ACFCX4_33035 [Kitasatospora sp. NPDC056327]|uniref:hypothetical protein n=1 Tax=Kitasatospora sp. NPDC056327 TaxID=3345785 RepID=UPI0035D97C19